MEFISVSARFLFFNGVKRYTVEYAYGLSCWYIFNEEEASNFVYKKIERLRVREINMDRAEDILFEFLEHESKIKDL